MGDVVWSFLVLGVAGGGFTVIVCHLLQTALSLPACETMTIVGMMMMIIVTIFVHPAHTLIPVGILSAQGMQYHFSTTTSYIKI